MCNCSCPFSARGRRCSARKLSATTSYLLPAVAADYQQLAAREDGVVCPSCLHLTEPSTITATATMTEAQSQLSGNSNSAHHTEPRGTDMDGETETKTDSRWTSSERLRAVILFVGNAVYALTKKSLSAAVPFLGRETSLTKSEIGIITANFSLANGVSKFVGGILCDLMPPRQLFGTGLLLGSLSTGAIGLLRHPSASSMSLFWMVRVATVAICKSVALLIIFAFP